MSSSKAIAASFTPDADVDLADRHRHGDETAFDEVYARYASMVYGLSLRMCGDPSRAQDLSQEVFIRVFRSLSRFRGRSSLRTWVYRVTLNHCRSRLGRKRVLTEPLDSPAGERQVKDPGRGPEDLTLSADAERIVTRGLLRLPTRFREAVVLRDLEGMSYREIADVLGIRLGTVRSRISRGREQLRVVLETEA